MDYYIVQKEEKNIDKELTNRLAEILISDLGFIKIDAKVRMKHFYGLLKVSEAKQALKLSKDFYNAGLDNFVLEEKDLVTLPERKILHENIKSIDMSHGLIAAGTVSQEKEQIIKKRDPFDVKRMFSTPIIAEPGMKEIKKTSRQVTYYIDIVTHDQRWGITKSLFPGKEIMELEQLDLLKTYLTSDIRNMFHKQRDITDFPSLKYYNEYLTWLMQVVYAKPGK